MIKKLINFIVGSTKCQNCGYPLDEHSNFCPNCGTEIGILQKNGDYGEFGGSHIRLTILALAICYVLLTIIYKHLF